MSDRELEERLRRSVGGFDVSERNIEPATSAPTHIRLDDIPQTNPEHWRSEPWSAFRDKAGDDLDWLRRCRSPRGSRCSSSPG